LFEIRALPTSEGYIFSNAQTLNLYFNSKQGLKELVSKISRQGHPLTTAIENKKHQHQHP
jgi:hypothetical protein